MKPKYKVGDIVRVKRTGKKFTVIEVLHIWPEVAYIFKDANWEYESELKPFCPSRTGTRDPKTGRFVSKKVLEGRKYWQDLFGRVLDTHKKLYCTHEHISGGQDVDDMPICEDCGAIPTSDSKQRNYQKISMTQVILNRLDLIEKKIDELGRRV